MCGRGVSSVEAVACENGRLGVRVQERCVWGGGGGPSGGRCMREGKTWSACAGKVRMREVAKKDKTSKMKIIKISKINGYKSESKLKQKPRVSAQRKIQLTHNKQTQLGGY